MRLGHEHYQAYLRSDEWQVRRQYMIARALNRCQTCNIAGGENGAGLDVHHRTYERLGEEWDADLIVLCNVCHSLFHENTELRRDVEDRRRAA